MGDSPFLPACAYRRIVPSEGEREPSVVCGCSGGLPIAPADGGGDTLAAICGPCTIPEELDSARRPCLYLVPVRIWEGAALRTGFSCRWFASLKPRVLPAKAWICCMGCPHWFPRPREEEAVPGMDRWIRKVIRMYWEPAPEPYRREPRQSRGPEPVGPGDRISARIRRLRVAWSGR